MIPFSNGKQTLLFVLIFRFHFYFKIQKEHKMISQVLEHSKVLFESEETSDNLSKKRKSKPTSRSNEATRCKATNEKGNKN